MNLHWSFQLLKDENMHKENVLFSKCEEGRF